MVKVKKSWGHGSSGRAPRSKHEALNSNPSTVKKIKNQLPSSPKLKGGLCTLTVLDMVESPEKLRVGHEGGDEQVMNISGERAPRPRFSISGSP
jgi:hypothetical protein